MSEPPPEFETPIPDRRYFTIGEVSKLCGVKDHVLRYWEEKIPQLQPTRRQGRRYYRRQDVALVRKILALTRSGVTIEGIIKRLRNPSVDPTPQLATQEISQIADDLERVVELLKEEAD